MLAKLALILTSIVALAVTPARPRGIGSPEGGIGSPEGGIGSPEGGLALQPAWLIAESRFGAVETYDAPAEAAALGAGWTRVRFPWADLQPNSDGEWNAAFFTDEMLAGELGAGRQVVGMIVNTPYWALSDPVVPGVPRGLYLPESDPGNVWATFVRQIVSRYAGRIDHWIIWNEPDIWDAAYSGRTWGGTVAEFFQLQRVAYNVAKQTNPNAVVHLAAFTYWWDVNYGRTPFFSLLMDEIQKDPQAAAHDFYFDVASANLYFDVDNIYDLLAWHHGQMIQRGFDKPIWLTETNAPPSSDPAWPVSNATFSISLDDQANFVPASFAMALAGGASRVEVYKLIDTPGDRAANPEPFGLVRDDGTRRPAFTAFQVAAGYLSGFTAATLEHRDGQFTQVAVSRGAATTTVLWTNSPAPVTARVVARSTQAIVVDALGRQQSVAPVDGAYAVELPGCAQPACVTGGPVRLLVEGAPAVAIPQSTSEAGQAPAQPTGDPAGPPTAAPSATPTPTPTPSLTVTPTPTQTAAPAPTSTPMPVSIAAPAAPPDVALDGPTLTPEQIQIGTLALTLATLAVVLGAAYLLARLTSSGRNAS